ncbi:MAG: lipoyl(octanoyl) transferase LipB [Sphingobacteriales bacterium]|nr:MAG: lipoyl(octanoyl) transferase LipB [Sphingobacteriales bacterium]
MNAIKNKEVFFKDLQNIGYKDAWELQEKYFNAIIAEKVKNRNLPENEGNQTPNYLFFCEHPNVYTLGKSGSIDNLLLDENQLQEKNIEFHKTNRGGDITYHGPEQIVGYPVLDLDNFFTDIHIYMRNLEEVIIRTLAEYGIVAGRLQGYTGVWLDENDPEKARKICAFGVKCSRWVTMHGWAFNVNADLGYFNNIIPCGIKDKDVTSMEKELGYKVDLNEVKDKLLKHFAAVFSCQIVGQ